MPRGSSKAAGATKSFSYLCILQQVLSEAAGDVAHIPWGSLHLTSVMLNLW